jgi:signal transduction histidine kinase
LDTLKQADNQSGITYTPIEEKNRRTSNNAATASPPLSATFTSLFSTSWILILTAAFLLVVMLLLLGIALNSVLIVVLAAIFAAAFVGAAGALYLTGRNVSAHVEQQQEVHASDIAGYAQSHLALTSGLEGMSEGLLLAQNDGKIIYANKRADEILKWCGRYVEGQRLNTVEEWLAKIRPFIANRDSFKLCMLAARQYSGRGQVPSFEFGLERSAEIMNSPLQQPLRPTPFVLPTGETGRDPGGDLATRPARDLRLTLFPIDDASGRQIGTGYLLRDVTRDRELDRLKDQFVSMVSHELRNPISVIISMSEILGDDNMPPEERQRWLSQINGEANRLRAMLHDMLELSRLEEGKLELLLAPVDLARTINRVVENARLQQQTPHEILVDFQSRHARVMADPGKLEQILTNLISNAIKYSPKGGKVTVNVRDHAPLGQDEEDYDNSRPLLLVSVSDEGMGIPEKEQAKIFNRFYRSSLSRRSNISGTGLGLSITQRLVKLMGGNIGFNSKEGSGTTFFFTIPAAR